MDSNYEGVFYLIWDCVRSIQNGLLIIDKNIINLSLKFCFCRNYETLEIGNDILVITLFWYSIFIFNTKSNGIWNLESHEIENMSHFWKIKIDRIYNKIYNQNECAAREWLVGHEGIVYMRRDWVYRKVRAEEGSYEHTCFVSRSGTFPPRISKSNIYISDQVFFLCPALVSTTKSIGIDHLWNHE